MKAVITVIGKDAVGILAKVSTICAETNANVIEVTQSVLQDKLTALGDSLGLKIHTMHEDIFNSMHRI